MEEPVVGRELGRGGRSVAFKLTLQDGTVGYYKVAQSFSAAYWHAEVAAYYLDRVLGIGRVPPVVGRRMKWSELRQLARHHKHLDEVIVREDGLVDGAFVGWVDGGLPRYVPGRGWEKWVRLNGGLEVSPYQRPAGWRGRNAAGDHGDDGAWADAVANDEDRAAELSDLILFDYLTSNVDRWGGGFTNLRTRGEHGPLVFLDNGAGFFPTPKAQNSLMDKRLETLQRFRRSTVDKIRGFDGEKFKRMLNSDPLAPVLTTTMLSQLEVRREFLLEHVEQMYTRFGDRVWL